MSSSFVHHKLNAKTFVSNGEIVDILPDEQTWTPEFTASWLTNKSPLHSAITHFPTKAPDPDWVRRFTDLQNDRDLHVAIGVAHEGHDFIELLTAAKSHLREGLLKWGGWAVCQSAVDYDIATLILTGVVLDGSKAKFKRGRPSRCHENSAWLAFEAPENYVMMSGYALSEDGLWREHSWALELFGRRQRSLALVETTEPRLAYYGFIRSHEMVESLVFEFSKFDALSYLKQDLERLKSFPAFRTSTTRPVLPGPTSRMGM